MLAPLNMVARPAPPALAASQDTANEPGIPSDQPQSVLTRVCQVEHVAIRRKIKRDKRGPSLYAIELFLCNAGGSNIIIPTQWQAYKIPEDRESDVCLEKTFHQVFELHDAVFAGMCGHTMNRVFMDTDRKMKLMQRVLDKFVFYLVRAQRPFGPNARFRPSCANQATLAELLAAFFDL